jgi:hypothetical protein
MKYLLVGPMIFPFRLEVVFFTVIGSVSFSNTDEPSSQAAFSPKR